MLSPHWEDGGAGIMSITLEPELTKVVGIPSISFTKVSSAQYCCSNSICSVKESLVSQIKEREAQEGQVVSPMFTKLEIQNWGILWACNSEHSSEFMLQNMPTFYASLLTYYILSRDGVMVSNIQAWHKSWGCISHSPVFFVFGLCGFANVQAWWSVPSASSLSSTSEQNRHF